MKTLINSFATALLISAFLFSANTVTAQSTKKLIKSVKKILNDELADIYGNSDVLTTKKDIVSSIAIADYAQVKQQYFEFVGLDQIDFYITVTYDQVTNDTEIWTIQETMKCTLGKHRSLKYNHLTVERNIHDSVSRSMVARRPLGDVTGDIAYVALK